MQAVTRVNAEQASNQQARERSVYPFNHESASARGTVRLILPFICCGAFAAIALLAHPSRAVDRFDLIIFNHDQVTTYGGAACYNDGYSSDHFGVLVNTGTQPITATDVLSATRTVTPVDPGCPVVMGTFDWSGLVAATPILPNEAITCPLAHLSEPLTSQLLPGETLRSSCTAPTIGYGVMNLCASRFQGTALFQVTIVMGGQTVRFPWSVDVRRVASYDSLSVSNVGSLRVSSSSAVAVRPTTWGRLKTLYR